MHQIRISETSLKQQAAMNLSFREKTELIRLLLLLAPDVIELPPIEKEKADRLFVKTAADMIRGAVPALPCPPDKDAVRTAAEALKDAECFRLQIEAPVSLVQMEYLARTNPDRLVAAVTESIAFAKEFTEDVEFIALDATRSERPFLYRILSAAAEAGAKTLTLSDTAGLLLPKEAEEFVCEVLENVPLSEAVLGITLSDTIHMADAAAVYALSAGAREVKAAVYPESCVSLTNLAELLKVKGERLGLSSGIRTVELKRIRDNVSRMFTETRSKNSPFDSGVRDSGEERLFTAGDGLSSIRQETERLGYALSDEDALKVYEAFLALTETKEKVSERELEALIASSAMEVPAAYVLQDCVINTVTSDNMRSSTAHIRLFRDGKLLESVAIGDGPIDAAFLSIEQIVGRHYELDDFQIRSVTEGREAMGETIVKLRHEGRIFSGRGLSTDIIQSGVSAYLSALNKIAYEEAAE